MPAFDYSSLIGGAIAGLAVLLVRETLEFYKDRKRIRTELHGLIAMVTHEIDSNRETTELLNEYPDPAFVPSSPDSLQTVVWEQCRARIVELLSTKHTRGAEYINTLLNYYMSVYRIKPTLADDRISADDKLQQIKGDIAVAEKLGLRAYAKAEYYISTEALENVRTEVFEEIEQRYAEDHMSGPNRH